MKNDPATKAGESGSKYSLSALLNAFVASGRSGQSDRPLIGVLFVFAAMAFLAALITLGRYAALNGTDPSQVVFFRNLFCVVWMLPLFAWRGMSLVKTQNLHLYGLRVGLSFIAMTAMFHSVALIPVGEVTAISFLSPLFGTAFAILMLGERVQIRRWMALFVGLIGALIILRPAGSEFGAGQLLALISACAVGVIGPLVKRLTREDDADRVVFLTNLLLTPLSLVPALFVWTWPSLQMWGLFAAMGFVAVLGHMSLVRAYAAMEASLVMTFKFVRLPFAVLFGYLAFREAIDGMTWLGGLIIFAASAYVTRREALLKKSKTTLQPPV
ncbi:MAG: DMT family transporter [Filomicrobium sp.]